MQFVKCLKHVANSNVFQIEWKYEDDYYLYGVREILEPTHPLEVISESDWMAFVSDAVYKAVCEAISHKVNYSLYSNTEDGFDIYGSNIFIVMKALEAITYTGVTEVTVELRPHVWIKLTESDCRRLLKNYNLKINNKNAYQKYISEKLCSMDKVYTNLPELLTFLSNAHDVEF